MHDNITLVATITARQGAREKVLLALKTVERDVQGEPGCLQYQLYMNRENDHQFVMIERWQSALMLENIPRQRRSTHWSTQLTAWPICRLPR